ncbi:unnamed protein product [Musa textilis]
MDLKMGNGARVVAVTIGDVTLYLLDGATIALDACYFVPYIIKNIIFISCLILNDYKVIFENNSCSIIKNNKIITRETLHNDLFMLDTALYIMNIRMSKKNQIGKIIKTL